MFRILLSTLLLTLVLTPVVSGQVVNRSVDGLTSSLYELGSNKENLLYTGEYSVKEEGNTATQRLELRDAQGTLVATEELVEKDGEFYRYGYQRLNANEGGTVTLEDGTLVYRYREGDDEETERMKLPERFVIGAMLTMYLRHHWQEILDGKEVHINYGVLDRQDMYRFKLFKDGETELNGKKTIIVQMKPATWLISLLVEPLYFYFTPDGKDVYEIKGRTIMLHKDGGGWEPLDAHTVYHHEEHKKK